MDLQATGTSFNRAGHKSGVAPMQAPHPYAVATVDRNPKNGLLNALMGFIIQANIYCLARTHHSYRRTGLIKHFNLGDLCLAGTKASTAAFNLNGLVGHVRVSVHHLGGVTHLHQFAVI